MYSDVVWLTVLPDVCVSAIAMLKGNAVTASITAAIAAAFFIIDLLNIFMPLSSDIFASFAV